MRAVLYARVSGADPERDSLGSQLELCREHARARGYAVVAELSEDQRGVSGADPEAQELGRALDMARRDEFDVLVTRDIQRFARNLLKHLVTQEQLNRAGVEVEYVTMQFDRSSVGTFHEQVMAAVAELERAQISERLLRGRRDSVRRGNVMVGGNAPFGYRQVVTEEDGRELRALRVDEGEAEVVRQIYGWYVHGDGENAQLSDGAIAQKLTHLGILTASDKGHNKMPKKRGRGRWDRSSVRWILTNATYVGEWTYSIAGETVAVPVPRIVDPDLYDAARRRRRTARQMSPRNVKLNYLLRGRATCGGCGQAMYAVSRVVKLADGNRRTHRYYRCAVANRPADHWRECDAPQSYRAGQVDAAVWAEIVRLFSNLDLLAEPFERWRAEQSRHRSPLQERLAALDARVEELQAQLARLLDLYLEGKHTRQLLSQRQEALERDLDGLERQRAGLAAQLADDAAPPVRDLLEFAADVQRGLAAADFKQRRWTVDVLDVRVVLRDRREIEIFFGSVPISVVDYA